jgi:hypothetical protein
MEKICKACGEAKPQTDFHKDRSKTDGLNAYCKPCTIAKQNLFKSRPPRHADPAGMKTCQSCKVVLELDQFHSETGRYDGKSRVCKQCAYARHNNWRLKNLDKMRDASRKWRTLNPELAKDHGRKGRYGLPIGAFERMLAEQKGTCAICETSDPGGKGTFHVDHCHDTGIIRGLLCHNCNVGIGNMRHSTDLLRRAITYLDQVNAVV